MAANPAVRLGAVMALIDLTQQAQGELNTLARSTLGKIAQEEDDEAIREVAQAYLEGRNIDEEKEKLTNELLQKLKEAEQRQQQQEQMLASAKQELETAREEASEIRALLGQSTPRREAPRINWRAFRPALAAALIPVLIPVMSLLFDRSYSADSLWPSLLGFALMSSIGSFLYAYLVRRQHPHLSYRVAWKGGSRLGAIGGLAIMVSYYLAEAARYPLIGHSSSSLYDILLSDGIVGVVITAVAGAILALTGGILGGLAALISLAILRHVHPLVKQFHWRALAIWLGIALIPVLFELIFFALSVVPGVEYYDAIALGELGLCSFIPSVGIGAWLYLHQLAQRQGQWSRISPILAGSLVGGTAGFSLIAANSYVTMRGLDPTPADFLFQTTLIMGFFGSLVGAVIGVVTALVASLIWSKRRASDG